MASVHEGSIKATDGRLELTTTGTPRKGDTIKVSALTYLVTSTGDGYIVAKAQFDGFEERAYNYSYDSVIHVIK